MKLTEKKIRQLVREELNIKSGRTQPLENSLDGYITRFIVDTMKYFAAELESAYDIEFMDSALVSNKAFQTDFEVYNRRQDIMKEGSIMMMHRQGEGVFIQIRGGMIGTPYSQQDKFIEKTIAPAEDPRQTIDIVSSFQILAGR